MAALFPSICNGQNIDVNGKPLASAVLTVYDDGRQILIGRLPVLYGGRNT